MIVPFNQQEHPLTARLHDSGEPLHGSLIPSRRVEPRFGTFLVYISYRAIVYRQAMHAHARRGIDDIAHPFR